MKLEILLLDFECSCFGAFLYCYKLMIVTEVVSIGHNFFPIRLQNYYGENLLCNLLYKSNVLYNRVDNFLNDFAFYFFYGPIKPSIPTYDYTLLLFS